MAKFMTSAVFKPLLAVAALSALAACSSGDLAVSSPSDMDLRPKVEMVRIAHDIAAEPSGGAQPSLASYDALYAFFERAEIGYGDAIVFDAGPNVAPERLKAFEKFVKARGLEFGGTHILGEQPGSGVITAYIERYIVIPPECGGWAPENTRDRRNNQSAYFACATTRNLALMVANPRDLIDGQAGAGNGNAVSALQAYDAQRAAARGPQTRQGSILRFDTQTGSLSPAAPSGGN